ncbi:MAG: hypothetical protein EA356_08880 [Geminicoccaceae bacterium]|nr:MAG: hypothetical protein EA356_08880 [Geminicoccaceae bacterium]
MLAVLGLALLAGCSRPAPPPFAEREVENALRVARVDFQAGRYDLAADQFERALWLARQLDDAAAIGQAGSERALSLLRADRPEEAFAAAEALADELALRPAPVPPLLPLVAGAAALAQGDLVTAEARLRPVTAAGDPAARGRAWYLLGLVADGRGDVPALQTAVAETAGADRLELEARLDLVQGRPAQALERLAEVRAARRDQADLDGLGEALALSGRAAAAMGAGPVAADFYLRAARNAAGRERTARATAWLDQAERLDGVALAAAIREVRARLEDG